MPHRRARIFIGFMLGIWSLSLIGNHAIPAGILNSASAADDCETMPQEAAPEVEDHAAGISFRLLGQKYLQTHNWECAIDAFSRSITLLGPHSPNSILSQELLARAYEQGELLDNAEKEWLQLLNRFGGTSDYDYDRRSEFLSKLGLFYMRQGRESEAEKRYLDAIELFESHDAGSSFIREETYGFLARLYESQDRYSLAADAASGVVSTIESTVEQVPEETDLLIVALKERARLLELAGRVDEAREDLARAENLSGQHL